MQRQRNLLAGRNVLATKVQMSHWPISLSNRRKELLVCWTSNSSLSFFDNCGNEAATIRRRDRQSIEEDDL